MDKKGDFLELGVGIVVTALSIVFNNKPFWWIALVCGLLIISHAALLRMGIIGNLTASSHSEKTSALIAQRTFPRKITSGLEIISASATLIGILYISWKILGAYFGFGAPEFFLPDNRQGYGRQFILISVRDITGYYRTYTSDEANRMTEPYRGKWVAVTGKVDDIQTTDATDRLLFLQHPDFYDSVALVFSGRPIGDIATFQKGYTLAAICKFQRASDLSVVLDNCELTRPPK